jgi:hypothetical protein
MALGHTIVFIRQHVCCDKYGTQEMRKKPMMLSVEDQEINNHIRCQNPSSNKDQPVDLIAYSLPDVPIS